MFCKTQRVFTLKALNVKKNNPRWLSSRQGECASHEKGVLHGVPTIRQMLTRRRLPHVARQAAQGRLHEVVDVQVHPRTEVPFPPRSGGRRRGFKVRVLAGSEEFAVLSLAGGPPATTSRPKQVERKGCWSKVSSSRSKVSSSRSKVSSWKSRCSEVGAEAGRQSPRSQPYTEEFSRGEFLAERGKVGRRKPRVETASATGRSGQAKPGVARPVVSC